jgi:hypothetical protein
MDVPRRGCGGVSCPTSVLDLIHSLDGCTKNGGVSCPTRVLDLIESLDGCTKNVWGVWGVWGG